MNDPQPLVIVAVNPAASFGSAPDVVPALRAALDQSGFAVEVLVERNFDALATVCAQKLGGARQVSALLVVGGDGMVSLGVNQLVHTDVPLGVIPTGTGNDFARGLGIPLKDPSAAIALAVAALARKPRRIDAGRIEGDGFVRYFLCVFSAGFDALVNERANRMHRPKGPSRYILALLAELVRLKPISYTLARDESAAHPVQASLFAIANGTSLGGGMKIAPNAKLDDGELDLVRVAPLGRLRFLRLFPSVFRGAHTELKEVSIARGRQFTIDAPNVIAYADGERVGPLPLTVAAEPGALLVLDTRQQ